jgi:hypothetical protein
MSLCGVTISPSQLVTFALKKVTRKVTNVTQFVIHYGIHYDIHYGFHYGFLVHVETELPNAAHGLCAGSDIYMSVDAPPAKPDASSCPC